MLGDASMEKKKITKASRRRLFLFGGVSLFLIGYFFFSVIEYSYSISNLNKEKASLENKLLALKEEEQNLKVEIEKLQDPEYIARYARENYLYSKDGEYIIKIEGEEQKEEEEVEESFSYGTAFVLGFVAVLTGFVILKIIKK